MSRAADGLRRVDAVIVASFGLIVLSPVLLAVAIAVRVDMGAPVLFRQRRLGRGGHPFEMIKFRTMRQPKAGEEGPAHDAERITRLGAFLRRTSLDELPSLVNLLRGDIDLVGPRPLPVYYWDRFRGDEFRRFEVRPGITGLAQVSGRNTLEWPEKLALDVQYVRERSLWGDVRIVVRTVPVVLGRGGVDHGAGVTMHELPHDRPSPPSFGVQVPPDGTSAPKLP